MDIERGVRCPAVTSFPDPLLSIFSFGLFRRTGRFGSESSLEVLGYSLVNILTGFSKPAHWEVFVGLSDVASREREKHDKDE